MNTLHIRPRRWARLTRACPLVVGRYRAAFIVRIAFISALPSAHGSKWLPGRTRRARTSRHYVVLSRVIEVSRDERATMSFATRIRVSSRGRRDARRPNRSRHCWPILLVRSFVPLLVNDVDVKTTCNVYVTPRILRCSCLVMHRSNQNSPRIMGRVHCREVSCTVARSSLHHAWRGISRRAATRFSRSLDSSQVESCQERASKESSQISSRKIDASLSLSLSLSLSPLSSHPLFFFRYSSNYFSP
jgi:hypothetical protein